MRWDCLIYGILLLMNTEKTNTEIELAWAAGFYDGEGSLSTIKPAGTCINYALTMEVSQVDRRPLERFHNAVGNIGKIVLLKSKRPNCSPIHRLTLTRKNAEKVIELLWPYLSDPKKEQIERCREKIRTSYIEPMSIQERSRLAVEARWGTRN